MPNGRNHARPSGRSPKPLPKKMPGRIASGPLAPTPWAPECPMAQLNPADTSISCRSLRYTSPFTERLVVSKPRSEEHTSELQSLRHLVCRLLLEKKKRQQTTD